MQIGGSDLVLRSGIVLAIGSHPDDIELGCGGTIGAASSAGVKVVAVFLTKGEKSGAPEIRREESLQALKLLGVSEVYFGDFPDTEIPSSREVIAFLESFCTKQKVDTVLTHTTNDSHQDHRQVGWLSLSAFRSVPRILAYETPRVTPSFSPTYFVDISNFVDTKWAALKCHLTQSDKRYLAYESMINLASFRGNQVNVRAAEGFEVIRYLEMSP
jgi:LmbE family N-acetylglucosaminyl deacetylase